MIVIVVQVADNLLRMEASQKGYDKKAKFGIIPGLGEIFKPNLPRYLEDEEVTILQRGHDIKLEGEASKEVRVADRVTRYAVQPGNFIGISPIPKMQVDVGDTVKAGDALFFDKKRPEIMHVAPVSGEVIEVNRGEKRAISEVVILADKEISYRQFTVPDMDTAGRDEIVRFMLESGAWTLLRQRPYNVIPDTDVVPDNIFISTFDSAPLAPDLNVVIAGQEEPFQQGLNLLSRLTSGKVHLGLDARSEMAPAVVYSTAENAEKHWFRGPHPVGNVGIQIHHIDPIRPHKKVWVIGVQEVITLGKLFAFGIYDASRVVALTGAPLSRPHYAKTYAGANIGELLANESLQGNLRYVSGDVLSGEQKSADQYLNLLDDQVTVLKEGNYHEMFGWLVPLKERPSISRTFPNFLLPNNQFSADTNTHGEPRAFVMTGQYERVLPMDIYPQHLMKAILTNNFEQMEGLGIHELNEEDIALCEFACTSKMPLQHILRDGLEMMREQGA